VTKPEEEEARVDYPVYAIAQAPAEPMTGRWDNRNAGRAPGGINRRCFKGLSLLFHSRRQDRRAANKLLAPGGHICRAVGGIGRVFRDSFSGGRVLVVLAALDHDQSADHGDNQGADIEPKVVFFLFHFLFLVLGFMFVFVFALRPVQDVGKQYPNRNCLFLIYVKKKSVVDPRAQER
jgi:hypothetical protein